MSSTMSLKINLLGHFRETGQRALTNRCFANRCLTLLCYVTILIVNGNNQFRNPSPQGHLRLNPFIVPLPLLAIG